MAIYEMEYILGFTDINKKSEMSNRAIIKVLENVAGMQSEKVGFGLSSIEKTGLSWVLLAWKIKVLNRPIYNTKITIKTWPRSANKIYTYRDFEIYDEKDRLCAIATSKWTLVNIQTGKLSGLSKEIINMYDFEQKSVFEEEEVEKLKEPTITTHEIKLDVFRSQIDVNNHVHNLCYLDFAYETLPEEVYNQEEFNNIEIMYKKQVKYGNKIKCKYSLENDKNTIVIKSEDEKILHAIIQLYN